MFFCYRGSHSFRDGEDAYQIGCALSDDLVKWVRLDDTQVFPGSGTGWDSNMTAYPALLVVKDKMYLFYNGNGFGESGFGIAELEFIVL